MSYSRDRSVEALPVHSEWCVNPSFVFRKTNVMDDRRVIDLYNAALPNDIPVEERRGHWVQEFYRQPELLDYVNSQFTDMARIREVCKGMSRP